MTQRVCFLVSYFCLLAACAHEDKLFSAVSIGDKEKVKHCSPKGQMLTPRIRMGGSHLNIFQAITQISVGLLEYANETIWNDIDLSEVQYEPNRFHANSFHLGCSLLPPLLTCHWRFRFPTGRTRWS